MWTKEAIIEELKRMEASGERTSRTRLENTNRAFINAIRSKFKTLKNAVESAGIDASKFLITGTEAKDSWTRDSIVTELKRIVNDEEALDKEDLLKAIRREFGGIKAAAEYAGLDFDYFNNAKKWSKYSIKRELLDILTNTGVIDYANLRDHFRSAVIREFGSIEVAAKEIGIDESKIIRRRALPREWSAEIIINEIKQLHSEGHPINTHYMVQNFPALQTAARKFFGNYNSALKAAGFEPEKIKLWNYRGPEGTIEAIKEIAENGEPLNLAYNDEHHHNIYCSARKYFGGWYQALEAAGIDPSLHRLDGTGDSFYGRRFQEIIREVIEVCGGYTSYNTPVDENRRVIPDFVINDETWMDSKLSSWSAFIHDCKEQVEKYLGHCSKLIIVYLRGNDIKHPNQKVEMRNVVFYYTQLEALGRRDLIDKIEDLRQQVEVKAG